MKGKLKKEGLALRGNSFYLLFLVLIMVQSYPGKALGAEKTLSLKDAVISALAGNDELKGAGSSLMASGEDVSIAKSFLFPKLTFSESFVRTNNPPAAFSIKLDQGRFTNSDFAISALNQPEPINNFKASLGIMQPLFNRKLWLGIDAAKDLYRAGSEEMKRKNEEVAFEVVKAYVDVLTGKELVKVSRSGLKDAREHLRIARLRNREGLGLYSDILRSSTALAHAEEGLVSAETRLEIAKQRLGLLLGISEPVDTFDEISPVSLKELQYYIDASYNRSDIRSLEAKLDGAKDNLKVARSSYLPTIGIGGNYEIDDHDSPFGGEGDNWQAGVFLEWNIFEGMRSRHETRKAMHKLDEAQAYLEGFKKKALFGVKEAYLRVKELMKKVELAEASLKSAEEGRRLVRVRFENSLSPIVDLLDAQNVLDNARLNLVSRKNRLKVALFRLGYESGTIMEDIGLKAAERRRN